jgi:hypothetical protein
MGATEASLVELLATLRYPDDDPRSDIGTLTVEIARWIDDHPDDTAAGVLLESGMGDLVEFPNEPAGLVTALRGRRLARQWAEYRDRGIRPAPASRREQLPSPTENGARP